MVKNFAMNQARVTGDLTETGGPARLTAASGRVGMGTRVTARFVDPLRNTDPGDAAVRTAVDMLAETGPCLRWLKGSGVDDGGLVEAFSRRR